MNKSDLGTKMKAQMNRTDIHDVWESTYRTAGNERFYEQCYDYIVDTVNLPESHAPSTSAVGSGPIPCGSPVVVSWSTHLTTLSRSSSERTET